MQKKIKLKISNLITVDNFGCTIVSSLVKYFIRVHPIANFPCFLKCREKLKHAEMTNLSRRRKTS